MRAAKERTAPAIIRLMEYRYLAPNPSHSLKPRLRSIAVHSRYGSRYFVIGIISSSGGARRARAERLLRKRQSPLSGGNV
jgi:hypothetical protein